MSDRKAYPSDLTDAEWEILEPLIPAISEEAVNVKYTRREIVNGILYVLRSGCPWRLVPHDLPAWGALYDYFRKWRKEGIWDQVQKDLLKRMRKREGRNEEPSAAVIDSQSIKINAVRGPEKGFDMGKRIPGQSHLNKGSGKIGSKTVGRSDGTAERIGSSKSFLIIKGSKGRENQGA